MTRLQGVLDVTTFVQFVTETLSARGPSRFILDGFPCAGKSRLAKQIATALSCAGQPAVVLSTDSFLVDRSLRRYALDHAYMDLWHWYRGADLCSVWQTVLSSRSACDLRFVAYDRVEGVAREERVVNVDPTSTTVILEGLFSMRAAGSAAADLSMFADVARDVARERILARRHYAGSRDQVLYEFDNIYVPSVEDYIRLLQDEGRQFDLVVDTSTATTMAVKGSTLSERLVLE